MPDQLPLSILTLPLSLPRIISVKQASSLDYYGPVDASISTEASKFLARFTNEGEPEINPTIEEFLRTTHNDCPGHEEEKRACWLTIRITKRSPAFKVPRWHQDGNMYPYDLGREGIVRSKYGLTLLGPPTLILPPDERAFTTPREGTAQYYFWQGTDAPRPSEEEMDDADAKLREWLANQFKDTPRVPIEPGQVLRFSWGRDDSPIHSEPDLISDRVFMTVLYGSQSELRSMCEWRDAEYGKVEVHC